VAVDTHEEDEPGGAAGREGYAIKPVITARPKVAKMSRAVPNRGRPPPLSTLSFVR